MQQAPPRVKTVPRARAGQLGPTQWAAYAAPMAGERAGGRRRSDTSRAGRDGDGEEQGDTPVSTSRPRRVTLADVARKAGVSQTTASFVLSGRGEEMRISAQVEERVRRAVESTGYRPNVISRSLRTGSTQTIGFVSDTIATTPYAGHFIWGALDAARENDRLLLIAETESDLDLERRLLETMRDRRVEGLILASMYTRYAPAPVALLDGPSVLLNILPTKPCGVPCVIPDEAEAGRTVARRILDAGHREGIYVVGVGISPARVPKESVAASERLRGMLEVLEAAGVELAGGEYLPDWQPSGGYQATNRILRHRRRPEALICFNDRISVGAFQALQDAGHAIGTDVSIVSFDDEPVASWLRPGLTSVALPHYELGRLAVEVLLGHAPHEQLIHRVAMPLRERESVRASAPPPPPTP